MSQKISLREAKEQGRLEEFIRQHETESLADKEEFDRLLNSIVGEKPKTGRTSQKPSLQGDSGD